MSAAAHDKHALVRLRAFFGPDELATEGVREVAHLLDVLAQQIGGGRVGGAPKVEPRQVEQRLAEALGVLVGRDARVADVHDHPGGQPEQGDLEGAETPEQLYERLRSGVPAASAMALHLASLTRVVLALAERTARA